MKTTAAGAAPATLAVDESSALSAAACLFRSFGDPARLAILRHLALGEHRVVDLTAHLGLAQSTVSAHLACLKTENFTFTGDRNLDKASDYAQRATTIAPEASFFDTLGYAYYKKGQHSIAVEQFDKAIERRPASPVARSAGQRQPQQRW